MALTMKFSAMLSPHRAEEDKFQDAHDFILLVKANPSIDTRKLAELGELVFGGGARLLEMVRQVRAGEKLDLCHPFSLPATTAASHGPRRPLAIV